MYIYKDYSWKYHQCLASCVIFAQGEKIHSSKFTYFQNVDVFILHSFSGIQENWLENIVFHVCVLSSVYVMLHW